MMIKGRAIGGEGGFSSSASLVNVLAGKLLL